MKNIIIVMGKFVIKLDKVNNIDRALKEAIEKKLDAALNDIADFIGTEADRILRSDDGGSFDTGFLANSAVVDKDRFLHKEVGFGALYAPYREYGCFFDSKTKVTTINGKKDIRDIKENDVVLTHTSSWKKVLKYIEYPINNIITEYVIRVGKEYLRVTSEHPILIRENNIEKWKLAKDIKLDDEIVLIKYNGMDLPGVKEIHNIAVKDPENRKKFGNHTYDNLSEEEKQKRNKAISDRAIKRYENPENRRKTGVSLRNSKIFQDKMKDSEYRNKVTSGIKKYYENNDVWNKGLTKETNNSIKSTSEKNSKYMTEYYKNNPEEGFERAEHMRNNSMFFNTKIEKRVKNELKKNNINHKNQYRIFDKINNKFYMVDHYLPEYNLIIEDYGNYWHDFPKGNDNDKERIQNIKNLGYNVLILWENDIKNNNFIEMILECIKNIKK